MSYLPVPSRVLAAPPGLTDDESKGYIEGSTVIDGSASPRAAHICVDPTPGAAVWRPVGAGSGLIGFAVSPSVDQGVALSPLTTPTDSAVSNGIIGGP